MNWYEQDKEKLSQKNNQNKSHRTYSTKKGVFKGLIIKEVSDYG